ncbi:DUF4349 domain-containing protein [Parerythrobacter lacustris]|uniref:DUF4349 domain-containing protein n=1 Tax=Parerythrobacter lacustris TaxID=2969984 RepID=A0ABT1XTK9_9SPHN|nr:DUF4349 domain-containing protein [Parerythrobacter lacustris]MCR2834993.1 DUF4349 domain-containing protein [Parerythrobacter lacustris]
MRQMKARGLKSGLLAAVAAASLLAGCSDNSAESGFEGTGEEVAADSTQSSAEMAEAAPAEDAVAREEVADPVGPQIPKADIPLSLPKIAYVYNYGFSLPGENIAKLQQEHADLCEQQGPYSCRIIGMDHSGEGGDYASGTLQLAVASDKARAFGNLLGSEAEMLEAEQTTHSISGEDLSKQIVDTEARVEARTVLRDRLLEVLRTRKGTVAELVEAERSVAQVNEEIDQARAWVSEMKTRVAFTRLDISYESSTPVASDFLAPIKGALGSLGSVLGVVIAALILLAAVLMPIAGVVFGGRAINRRMNRRPEPAPAEA